MSILKKSSKLESKDPNAFFLKPIAHTGCLDLSVDGTPAYDPNQKEKEPMQEVPEQKPDHRPKDWHEKQCSFEGFIKGLVLNDKPLNKAEGDSKNDV